MNNQKGFTSNLIKIMIVCLILIVATVRLFDHMFDCLRNIYPKKRSSAALAEDIEA
jgi:hypothetical protein